MSIIHLSRRAAIRRFGIGLAALPMARLLAACTSESGNAVDAAAGGDGGIDSGLAAGDAACSETLEGEIGPYFADDSADGFARSNVLANLDGSSAQTGVPFTLTIYVYDSEAACTPYAGAQIDIWHCNASGVYSDIAGEDTTGQQWLRGYQLTDATGKVTFTTIIPGWYQGRTTHIHARVRSTYSEASSTSDGTNTTQLFFPQTLVDTLSTTVAPYSAEGVNPTTNAGDHVYGPETASRNELVLAGSTAAGYTATFAIYLPIDDAGGSGSDTGGGPGGPGSGGPGSGSGSGSD
jgi:protocatechuate 3,4-dioxygenase beta subunit